MVDSDEALLAALAAPAVLTVVSGHAARRRGRSYIAGTNIDRSDVRFGSVAVWLDGCRTGFRGEHRFLTPQLQER